MARISSSGSSNTAEMGCTGVSAQQSTRRTDVVRVRTDAGLGRRRLIQRTDARNRTGAALGHRKLTDDWTLFLTDAMCEPGKDR